MHNEVATLALRQAFRIYNARCLAHRLRKFGFESHINSLPPEDLRLIAAFMPPHQAKMLTQEAERTP